MGNSWQSIICQSLNSLNAGQILYTGHDPYAFTLGYIAIWKLAWCNPICVPSKEWKLYCVEVNQNKCACIFIFLLRASSIMALHFSTYIFVWSMKHFRQIYWLGRTNRTLHLLSLQNYDFKLLCLFKEHSAWLSISLDLFVSQLFISNAYKANIYIYVVWPYRVEG